MQIVTLAAFIVVLSLPAAPARSAPGWVVLALAALYVALAAAMSGIATRLAVRRLDRPGAALQRRHGFLAAATQAYLVLGLAAVLYLGLGNWVSHSGIIRDVPLLSEALRLAPFLAALLLTWAVEYPAHRRMRLLAMGRPPANAFAPPLDSQANPPVALWTRRQYVTYNLRHNFLFIAAPVALVLLAREVLVRYVWPGVDASLVASGRPAIPPEALQTLENISTTAASLIMLVLAPAIIVRVLRTVPLPAGEFRDELMSTLARLRLRCRDILIWQSHGVVANAGVMGVLPRVRYVLLSDALLDHMDRRLVMAVFAHEVGHITSHHLFYSALFALGTVLLAGVFADAAGLWLHFDYQASELVALALLAAAWGLLFGWISRRFERQSDVIGAWTAGQSFNGSPDPARITPEGAATFARALHCVADLNGTPYDSPNWRHGTIQHRVNYILWLGSTQGTRRDIDRTVRRIKVGLWALFAAAIAALVAES